MVTSITKLTDSNKKQPITVVVDGKQVTRFVTNWTTIRIRKQTRDRIEELGEDGEPYDAIISRLLDKLETKKK